VENFEDEEYIDGVNDESNNLEDIEEDGNIVRFPNTKVTGGEEQQTFTDREKEAYLKYIEDHYNKEDGSIPANLKVIEACKNRKTIRLNATKVGKIRKDLYKENVLVEPKKRGKTYFAPEYLSKLEVNSDQNSDQIQGKI
jgi:hypothetical protein